MRRSLIVPRPPAIPAADKVRPNLVTGDTNAMIDAFVRDWQAGTIRQVSISSAGQQGNGASGDTAISTSGRHVTFGSFATNLVPGDTNESIDIFIRAS
jgi:TolB protein